MSSNDAKTVPVPNRPVAEKMSDQERDGLLLQMAGQMTNVSLAVNEFKRLAPIVEGHGKRLDSVEQEVATLKTQVVAGVHIMSADAAGRVLVPSLPPMREHFDTHESINAVALRQDALVIKQEALDVKQDAQLKNQDEQKTMLQKMRTAQRQNALMALAAAAGVFFANYANNCHPTLPQVPQHVLAPAPYVAPAPAQTPPPPPSH